MKGFCSLSTGRRCQRGTYAESRDATLSPFPGGHRENRVKEGLTLNQGMQPGTSILVVPSVMSQRGTYAESRDATFARD